MRAPEETVLELRRIRLDRWRVIYVVDEELTQVGVLAIRKRPPYDYKDLPELLAELD
jgi:mRNA interferase RelE/StbE